MRKFAWTVWIVAFLYNVYGTWVLGRRRPVPAVHEVSVIPLSLRDLKDRFLIAGPILS